MIGDRGMPIYEYQCKKCGEIAEVLQKFSDPPVSECQACGGQMDKLMSMNSFQLKGSGWYVTDYKAKNASTTTPSKDKDSSADAKPSSKDGGKDGSTSKETPAKAATEKAPAKTTSDKAPAKS